MLVKIEWSIHNGIDWGSVHVVSSLVSSGKFFYCPLLTVKKIAYNGISMERSNFKRHFLETNKLWDGPLYLQRAHLYLQRRWDATFKNSHDALGIIFSFFIIKRTHDRACLTSLQKLRSLCTSSMCKMKMFLLGCLRKSWVLKSCSWGRNNKFLPWLSQLVRMADKWKLLTNSGFLQIFVTLNNDPTFF